MWRNNKIVQTASLALGVLSLSACQPEAQSKPQSESNVKFSAPLRIMQARAIDKSKLSPTVTLSDGTTIAMQKTGDNAWSGTVNVQPNRDYSVTVIWYEAIPDAADLLQLASWSKTVPVTSDGAQISLSDGDYDTSADYDGDGISNLQEREDNTDPFISNEIMADADGNATDETGAQTDSGSMADDTGNTDDAVDTDETGATEGSTTDGGTIDMDSDGGSTAGNDETAGETDADDTDGDTTVGDSGNTLTRARVLIPRVLPRRTPDIDGKGVVLNNRGVLTGEWANAVQTDNTGEGLWIDRLMISNASNEDPSVDGDKLHRWAAMHDGVNLYVLILSDDVGRRSSDGPKTWQDDALELFIDGNNSKQPVWDDDDFHYHVALQQLNSTESNDEVSGRVTRGPNVTSTPFDFMFATGPGIGPSGIRVARFEQDVYELAIPITAAGITIGKPFGFEVQLDDDDNGDGRDAKWGWAHPSRVNNANVDLTYQDPSIMGVLILEE